MTRQPKRNSKARRPRMYKGDLPYLMEIVRLTRVPGQWQKMGNYWRYRCENGGIFNWWPSTGTFNFQGPAEQKERFAVKMAIAANEHGHPADHSGTGVSINHIPDWSEGQRLKGRSSKPARLCNTLSSHTHLLINRESDVCSNGGTQDSETSSNNLTGGSIK